MKVKIYKPAKSAMQSGRGNSSKWVLEYEVESPRRPEPVMGWTAANDTLNQVQMKFESKDAAIAFAECSALGENDQIARVVLVEIVKANGDRLVIREALARRRGNKRHCNPVRGARVCRELDGCVVGRDTHPRHDEQERQGEEAVQHGTSRSSGKMGSGGAKCRRKYVQSGVA